MTTLQTASAMSRHLRYRSFLAWLMLLYGGWIAAWLAHEALIRGPLPELADRTTDTGYWLACKIIVWLVPVVVFIRRDASIASIVNMFDWLGLSTTRGLLFALPICAAWLGNQAAADLLLLHRLPRAVPIDAAVMSALVVSPLLEEVLFRGFALRHLQDRGVRNAVAVGLTASAWALLHVPGWLFQAQPMSQLAIRFAGIMIFGVFLGTLRLGARSLWAPILAHFVNNAWHQGTLAWLWGGRGA